MFTHISRKRIAGYITITICVFFRISWSLITIPTANNWEQRILLINEKRKTEITENKRPKFLEMTVSSTDELIENRTFQIIGIEIGVPSFLSLKKISRSLLDIFIVIYYTAVTGYKCNLFTFFTVPSCRQFVLDSETQLK